MLVLTRKREESVIVTLNGVKVKVMVLGGSGDKVRLGIDAPRDVAVYREEVEQARESGQGDPEGGR